MEEEHGRDGLAGGAIRWAWTSPEVSDVPEVPSNAGEMCEHLRDALLDYDRGRGMLDGVEMGVTGMHGPTGPRVAIEFSDGSRYIVTVHHVRPGREPDDPDAE